MLVVYDPKVVSLDELLTLFWEEHDPTQGMRQGNDIGTTYRSVIYTFDKADRDVAEKSREAYSQALASRGLGQSRPRSRMRRSSIMLKTTTSNIWRRTRTVIADCAALA